MSVEAQKNFAPTLRQLAHLGTRWAAHLFAFSTVVPVLAKTPHAWICRALSCQGCVLRAPDWLHGETHGNSRY